MGKGGYLGGHTLINRRKKSAAYSGRDPILLPVGKKIKGRKLKNGLPVGVRGATFDVRFLQHVISCALHEKKGKPWPAPSSHLRSKYPKGGDLEEKIRKNRYFKEIIEGSSAETTLLNYSINCSHAENAGKNWPAPPNLLIEQFDGFITSIHNAVKSHYSFKLTKHAKYSKKRT